MRKVSVIKLKEREKITTHCLGLMNSDITVALLYGAKYFSLVDKKAV